MQNDLSAKKNLLTIGEASEYLGISIDTLRRWERKNRIEPLRSPGGHRYFNKEDLDNLFGKKYVRDEPTIRRKGTEIENENGEVNTKPVEKIINESILGFEPETYDANQSHFSSLISQTFPVLDRPVREVKIPEVSRIKITRAETILSPQEAYFRQQSVSVLTPPNVIGVNPSPTFLNPQTPSQINPEIRQSASEDRVFAPLATDQNNKKDASKTVIIDKNILIISGSVAGVIIVGVVWYLIYLSSQRILSPIP